MGYYPADLTLNISLGGAAMFSHIFVGVRDFEQAFAFYEPLMTVLEIELRFCERNRPWAGWQLPNRPVVN